MLQVKYIGSSPSGKRLLAGKTLITWVCQDDVQDVPDSASEAILSNPHVWEIVGRTDVAEPVEIQEEAEEQPIEPPLVDLSAMSKDQLQVYCQREFGEQVDKRWSESRIRQYITSQIGKRR